MLNTAEKTFKEPLLEESSAPQRYSKRRDSDDESANPNKTNGFIRIVRFPLVLVVGALVLAYTIANFVVKGLYKAATGAYNFTNRWTYGAPSTFVGIVSNFIARAAGIAVFFGATMLALKIPFISKNIAQPIASFWKNQIATGAIVTNAMAAPFFGAILPIGLALSALIAFNKSEIDSWFKPGTEKGSNFARTRIFGIGPKPGKEKKMAGAGIPDLGPLNKKGQPKYGPVNRKDAKDHEVYRGVRHYVAAKASDLFGIFVGACNVVLGVLTMRAVISAAAGLVTGAGVVVTPAAVASDVGAAAITGVVYGWQRIGGGAGKGGIELKDKFWSKLPTVEEAHDQVIERFPNTIEAVTTLGQWSINEGYQDATDVKNNVVWAGEQFAKRATMPLVYARKMCSDRSDALSKSKVVNEDKTVYKFIKVVSHNGKQQEFELDLTEKNVDTFRENVGKTHFEETEQRSFARVAYVNGKEVFRDEVKDTIILDEHEKYHAPKQAQASRATMGSA